MQNIFTLPELETLFEVQGSLFQNLIGGLQSPLMDFAERALAGHEISEATLQRVSIAMQKDIADLQRRDRQYWRDIIADLKNLRASGKSMAKGAAV